MKTAKEIQEKIREIVALRKVLSEEIKTIHQQEIMGRRAQRSEFSKDIKNLVTELRGLGTEDKAAKREQEKAERLAKKAEKARLKAEAAQQKAEAKKAANTTVTQPVAVDPQPVTCGPGALNQ